MGVCRKADGLCHKTLAIMENENASNRQTSAVSIVFAVPVLLLAPRGEGIMRVRVRCGACDIPAELGCQNSAHKRNIDLSKKRNISTTWKRNMAATWERPGK